MRISYLTIIISLVLSLNASGRGNLDEAQNDWHRALERLAIDVENSFFIFTHERPQTQFTDAKAIQHFASIRSDYMLAGEPSLSLAVVTDAPSDETKDSLKTTTLKYFSKILSGVLIQNPKLILVNRDQMENILKEQRIQHGAAADEMTVCRLGRLRGIKYMIFISVEVSEIKCDFFVKVIDVETGTELAPFSGVGIFYLKNYFRDFKNYRHLFTYLNGSPYESKEVEIQREEEASASPRQRSAEENNSFSELLGDFVQIPAGTFMMGSPSNESGRDSDENQHQVTLTKDFEIMKTEVTQKMWVDVMQSNPSRFQGDTLPVEQVSWDDVQVFIDRLNHKNDGYTYRLPTEEEWEYAARAGTQTAFNLGDNITPDQVNYDGNYPYKNARKGIYRKQTVPVGSLPSANAFGLYDMHGNVWEWVLDPYSSDYSTALSQENANTGAFGTGSNRVIRGGSCYGYASDLRSAYRYVNGPDIHYYNVGFRLVRTQK